MQCRCQREPFELDDSHYPLSRLGSGEEGVIIALSGSCCFRQRLMEMGFLPGTLIQKIKSAPLGDPAEYLIRGYRISLRRKEAAKIWCTDEQPSASLPAAPKERLEEIL